MIKSYFHLFSISILFIASGCYKTDSESDARSPSGFEQSFHFVGYNFDERYYCVPVDDFEASRVVSQKNGNAISRFNYSRSDALLGEGSLIDKVRFYKGRGSIALKKNIPQSFGYYLRVLNCEDIFSDRKNIRGFTVYVNRL